MKYIHKVFLVLAIFLFLSPIVSQAVSTNTSFNMVGDWEGVYTIAPITMEIVCDNINNSVISWSGGVQNFSDTCTNMASVSSEVAYGYPIDEPHIGTNYVIEVTTANYDTCIAGTYEECVPLAVSQTTYTTYYNQQVLPQTNSLGDITSSATSTFATATGIEYTELTAWSGSMIAMVLGSGLGVLSALMPWIIAIMVVMGIVGFLYAGFRFFRH